MGTQNRSVSLKIKRIKRLSRSKNKLKSILQFSRTPEEHTNNMKIEIDQSGKIENTSKHTYLAFSDHQHFVLKISSVEKRKLQKYFRAVGKPKLFIYLTFAALIILLLKNFKSKHYQAIVDVEYPGRNNLIKSFIKLYGQGLSIKDISFHQIGKKSRAHYLASGTAIKKLSPDMIVNAKQVLKIIRKSGSA